MGRTEEIVSIVLESPLRVGELFECLFCPDEIIRMRASDALEKVCAQDPSLLVPFTERLLTEVSRIEQPSVQWHLAQILGEMPLEEADKLGAWNLLKSMLSTTNDWIVKNMALASLGKLVRKDGLPRLELLDLLQIHAGSPYKSVRSRVAKLLKEFSP